MSVRRVLVCAVAVTCLATLVPGAGAASGQVVAGRVRFGSPFGDELARRTWAASDGAVNGLTGFVFELERSTIGGRFHIDPVPGSLLSSLQVSFYDGGVGGTRCGSVNARQGVVPCGTHAVVWMIVGADAVFLYTASGR